MSVSAVHMARKRKLLFGAKARECAACRQAFRPMTEAQWEHNRQQHELLSLRHKRAIGGSRTEMPR
jgi:hypothetical protein